MPKSRIAEAYVQVVPRIDGIASSLQAQLGPQVDAAGANSGKVLAQGMSNSFAGKIKGYLAPVVASFAGTFAAMGVANVLKDSINVASDFVEQGAAVGQVFGKAAGDIQKFAESAAVGLGQSKVQVLDAAKQFGIYGNAAGLAGKKNAEFSTDLVKLATDLASFNNTSVDEAIQALGAGLRGESEPLRRYGVLLNDAALKAEAMKMKIYDGKGPLDAQAKVLAANAVIFKQTTTQQGDFARTSEGLANQQRILAANFENTKIALGTNLLPVMNNLVKFANDSILPAVNGIGDAIKWMQENTKVSIPIMAGLGAALLTALAPSLWAAVTATWAWTAALLANPMTWIVIGVGLLIGAIVALAMNWDKVTKFVSDVWAGFTSWLNDSLKSIGKWWNDTWSGVGRFFTGIWNGIVKFFNDTWTNIGRVFKTALDFVVNLFLNWTLIGLIIKNWGAITKFFGDSWNSITKFFSDAMANIARFVSTGINNVVSFFGGLGGKIMSALSGAGKWLWETGKNIVQGLMDGISSLAGSIGSFFLKLLPSWIVDPFKAALGIHSPSKVFKEFGKNILDGLREGLVGENANVKDTMKKVSSWLTDAFEAKKISASANKAGQALVKAFGGQLQKLEAQHSKLMERLEKAQQELEDKVTQRADFIKNIAEQFGSKLDIQVKTVDQAQVLKAKNDLAKAQEKYNGLLADTKSSVNDIEDARLAVVDAEKQLADAQDTGTTAKSAIQALKDKVAKTTELLSLTSQLEALGLNKDLYKQIVEAGAVDFAKSIIEGGAQAVNELNVLNDQANTKALELATKVGDTLYAQGIKFAQSVVDGLKAQEANLTALMNAIAAAFEKQISLIVQGNITAIQTAVSGAKAELNSAIASAKAAISAANKAAENAKKTTTVQPKAAVTPTPITSKAVSQLAGSIGMFVNGLGVPKLASGGFVNAPTMALIGEAGPEVVTPLKDFERMVGLNNNEQGMTVNYYAAPNNSLDAEQALYQAMKRAKAVGAW